MRDPGFRVGPKSNDRCSYKRKAEGYFRYTEGRWPRKDGGRDWREASTNQRMPRITIRI